jgi:hypothetical protein
VLVDSDGGRLPAGVATDSVQVAGAEAPAVARTTGSTVLHPQHSSRSPTTMASAFLIGNFS